MSTRSLTRVFEADEQIVCIYRHCDGYPEGIGSEIAEFLSGRRIVNGIPVGRDSDELLANGAGDLAAQLVTHLKKPYAVGNVYVHSTKTKDIGEEYEYHIHVAGEGKAIILDCYEVTGGYRQKRQMKRLFSGEPEHWKEFIKEEIS